MNKYFFSFTILIFNLNFSVISFAKINLSNDNWQAIIDSTWGEGLPTEEKLKIFDYAWDFIDLIH